MKSALADINNKILSLNKAAAQYGIPKSTLSMKLSGKTPPNRKMIYYYLQRLKTVTWLNRVKIIYYILISMRLKIKL